MRTELEAAGSTVNAAESRAARFELYLLGPFRMSGERGPVDLGNRKKLCGLTAFLACARVPQRRDILMSLLWGSHFDAQAQQNLRKALSRLRQALGEDIFLNGDELISLRPGAVACDVTRFERLIEEGSPDSLRRAIDLYRDVFLSDVSIQEEGWVRWIADQRNRIDGLMVDALVRLGEAQEVGGDVHGALHLATQAVAMDELREDAHRLIIRCLIAAGRQAEAARRYDRLCVLLRRELAVEPDARTRSLIEQLRLPPARLHQQDAVKTVVPGNARDPTVAAARAAPIASSRAAENDLSSLQGPVATATGRGLTKFAPFGFSPTVALSALGILVIAVTSVGVLGWNSAMNAGGARTSEPRFDGVPIAVLPFVADDAESRRSANMITDDLINLLSRVPRLNVVGQSSQRFASRPIDVAAIGRELAVRYVVDGNVRSQGERLRVNVEFVATEDRVQVWSDQFERDRPEAGTTRDEIVKGIGRALQVATIRAESTRMARQPSDPPDVHGLIAAGWVAMMASSSANTLPQAEAAFREALRRDPQDVRAMAGLAAHHLTMVGDMHTAEGETYLAQAEQLLNQVLKKHPDAHQPYFYLGILRRERGELQPALDSFAQSTTLNPSFTPGYAHRGSVLTLLGRFDDALEQIGYAMRVSPKDPNFQTWTLFAAWAEIERKHDRAALEWLFRALALNPRSAPAHGMIAAAYALDGDSNNAAKYAAKFRQLTPGFSDQQRLNGLGAAFLNSAMPHRLIDGCRLALNAPG